MATASTPANAPADASEVDVRQLKDFLISYNRLAEFCFNDCVWDFTTRDILRKEEKCSLNCAEKFLKMNQRISQRFHEFQILSNENLQAAAQKLPSQPT